jgi:hypothetical protein
MWLSSGVIAPSGQRGAIPALDKVSDDPHRLIAAAPGPMRLVTIGADPDQPVHQARIAGIGIGRSIPKAQKVARAFGHPIRPGRDDRDIAFLLPAQDHPVGHGFENVAQGVDGGILGIGTDLQQQIAMAKRPIQRIIGKPLHPAETARLQPCKPWPVFKQRGPERERDRQRIRRDHRPEDP